MKKLLIALSLIFITGCASPGVIGVGYNKEGVVKYIFKSSPAEKAGIQLNDQILNTKDLRGKVTRKVLVKYKRGGATYELLVDRVHIDSLKNEGYGEWK
jgi:C-terminal processing protease CtpA/Prc